MVLAPFRPLSAASVLVVLCALAALAPTSPATAANGRIAVALWTTDCGGTDCYFYPRGVVLVRPDGRKAHRLPLRYGFAPQFSADGRLLAVQVDKPCGIVVGRWNADRFRYVDRCGDGPGYDGMDWSPRSAQLVFAKQYENGSGRWATKLVRVSAWTSTRQVLGAGSNPAWSPDGDRIAFLDGTKAFEQDVNQIVVVGASGQGRRTVASLPGTSLVSVEQWSADGQSVLYDVQYAEVESEEGLFAVNVTTGAITQVQSPPYRGLLSPDGRLLARESTHGVYVSRRNGTHRHRILGPPRRWHVDGYTVADWQYVP